MSLSLFFTILPLLTKAFAVNLTVELENFPVGIASSSNFPNSQLGSSSDLGSYYHRYYARLNAYASKHSWAHNPATDTNPFLQIVIGVPWRICKISTQGDMDSKWLAQFTISYHYPEQHQHFISYSESGSSRTFNGNTDATGVVTNIFNEPFLASYVRIHPVGTVYALRVELYGRQEFTEPAITVGSTSYYNSDYSIVSVNTNNGYKQTSATDYLAADLGQLHGISSVGITGVGNDRITSYQFYYSTKDDAVLYALQGNPDVWTCYSGHSTNCTTLEGPYSGVQSIRNFDHVVTARHVLILPLSSQGEPILKLSLYGTQTDSTTIMSDLGESTHPTYTSSSVLSDYYVTWARPNLMNNFNYAWVGTANDAWIQVHLKKLTQVRHIKIRGNSKSGLNCGPKYYTVYYGVESDLLDCIKNSLGLCQSYFHTYASNPTLVSVARLEPLVIAMHIRIQTIESTHNQYTGAVFDVLGPEAPGSCSEYQIRLGFPDSGSYHLSVDSSYITAECDMSVVPAATILHHSREDLAGYVSGRSYAVREQKLVQYSSSQNMVEFVVNNSMSCEVPFYSRVKAARLHDSYWSRDVTSTHYTRSFSDGQVPSIFTDPDRTFNMEALDWIGEYAAIVQSLPGIQFPFYVFLNYPTQDPTQFLQPFDETTFGLDFHYDGIAIGKLGQEFVQLLNVGAVQALNDQMWDLHLHLKLYRSKFEPGGLIYHNAPNGTIITYADHWSQFRIIFKKVGGASVFTQFTTPKYLIPSDIYFLLSLQYNVATGRFTMQINCKTVYVRDFTPTLIHFDDGEHYIGLYPHANMSTEHSGRQLRADISGFIIILNIELNDTQCSTLFTHYRDYPFNEKISDCSDLPTLAATGRYVIHPHRIPEGLNVRCNQDSDGGGWIVWYNRESDAVRFTGRLYQEFQTGFGDHTNFFIGTENLHRITTSGLYELRMEIEGYDGTVKYSHYTHFIIGNEYEDYLQNIGKQTGTAGHSLTGWKFGTAERGTAWVQSCGRDWTAGWFYSLNTQCSHTYMFNNYFGTPSGCESNLHTCQDWSGLTWHTFANNAKPVRRITGMIRRVTDRDILPLLVGHERPDSSFTGEYLPPSTRYRPALVRFGGLCVFSDWNGLHSAFASCAYCTKNGNPTLPEEYNQIDMGQFYIVKAIGWQVRLLQPNAFQRITSFKFYYSSNNKQWYCVTSNCDSISTELASVTSAEIKYIEIANIPPSRYIRLKPTAASGHCCFRAEIFVKQPRVEEMPTSCDDFDQTGKHRFNMKYTNITYHTQCYNIDTQQWMGLMDRTDGSSDFNSGHDFRSTALWAPNSQSGFDYMLDLETWFSLTRYHSYKLRILMEDFQGNEKYSEYHGVKILSKKYGYSIRAESYDSSSTAGDALELNAEFKNSSSCGVHGWFGVNSTCQALLTADYHECNTSCTAGIRWKTFSNGDVVALKSVKMLLKRYDTDVAGWNLPSYSFGGIYKQTPECRPFNARLFADGNEGLVAWCAPSTVLSDEVYLSVDLRAQYHISAIVTQGLESGRVTKYKLKMSKDGKEWFCYNSCEIINVTTSNRFSYLHRTQLDITNTPTSRYVRIIPVDYDIYPKVRVEFITTPDLSPRDSYRHKITEIYGSLVDYPDKRSHPVGKIGIGGTMTEDSFITWAINGPLRCYQAYKTCADIKLAGLPSGVYWLDSDGVGGDPPFEAHCEVNEDYMRATVQPAQIVNDPDDYGKVDVLTRIRHTFNYGGLSSLNSYESHTSHLATMSTNSYWSSQYYKLVNKGQNFWDLLTYHKGSASAKHVRPNSFHDRVCECWNQCDAGNVGNQWCNTYKVDSDYHIDEGYMSDTNLANQQIQVPLTAFYPQTGGADNSMEIGPAQYYNLGRDYQIMNYAEHKTFTAARDRCTQAGYDLASYEELVKAWKQGFDSSCYFGWVREGRAYASRITRYTGSTTGTCCGYPKAEKNISYSVGIYYRGKDTAHYNNGIPFCSTRRLKVDAEVKPNATSSTALPLVSETLSAGSTDYCSVWKPCKSHSTCVNDLIHFYTCHCLNKEDVSKNCTIGLPSCKSFQELSAPSDYYYIDPDGLFNGESSFEVYCDMSTFPPVTRVEHNRQTATTYSGVSNKGGAYALDVGLRYINGTTYDQLSGLTDRAAFCHQKITYHSQNHNCYNNMKYLSGQTWQYHGILLCDCYARGDCETAHSSHKCGCSSSDANTYKKDSFTITDSSQLPVMQMLTGQIDSTSRFIMFKISPLECVEGYLYNTCAEYKIAGFTTSGTYKLAAGSTKYCDMSGDYEELSDPCTSSQRYNPDRTSCLFYTTSVHKPIDESQKYCVQNGGNLPVMNNDRAFDVAATIPGYQIDWHFWVNMYLDADWNIALNKPVTCSTELLSHTWNCARVTDGGLLYFGWHANDRGFQWAKIDLEEEYEITFIRMITRDGSRERNKEMYIATSTLDITPKINDSAWTEHFYAALDDTQTFDITIAPTRARYIYTGTNYPSSEHNQWCVFELQVGETPPAGDRTLYSWSTGAQEDQATFWRSGNHPVRNSPQRECVFATVRHGMESFYCKDSRYTMCEIVHTINSEQDTISNITSLSDERTTNLDWSSAVDYIPSIDEADPCFSSPCLNNGTCTGQYWTQTYVCDCIAAFRGDNCEISLFCSWPGIPESGFNITMVSPEGIEYLIENENSTINGIAVTDYNYTVFSYIKHDCLNGTVVEGSSIRTCTTDLQFSGLPPVCAELSSCIDYQLRCFPSGEYTLDFDGPSGPLPPLTGYCDMSTTPPTTILHHQSICPQKVSGALTAYSYTYEADYGVSYENVKALVDRSSVCTQTFYYKCYASRLKHYFGWVGSDNTTVNKYFDSNNWNRFLQCDYADYRWREETGTINELSKLPIRRLLFGGQVNEEWSVGFHTVGSLRCQQGYRSCLDYKMKGLPESSYWIDPDGLGGTPPVFVRCDFDSDEITITHTFYTNIHHFGYWRVNFNGIRQEFINYSPNTVDNINKFMVAHTTNSQQRVDYRTYNSRLFNGDDQYSGWLLPNLTLSKSFIGDDNKPGECACLEDGNCRTQSVKCNSADFNCLRQHIFDYGIITSPVKLPVAGFQFGDQKYDACREWCWYCNHHRYAAAALGHITAQVTNEASVPYGEDCEVDETICQSLTCLSDNTCGCDVVNNPNSLNNPHDCYPIDPCSTLSPCQNSGSCSWNPWTDLRYSCSCDGNWGGVNCTVEGAVNGGWGDWSNFTECTGVCGNGTEFRNRSCSDPAPRNGGSECVGSPIEYQICLLSNPCPIDGEWSGWGNWSDCSVTCGDGIEVRNRSCDDPEPQHGGVYCNTSGEFNETQSQFCQLTMCPINGNWSLWTNWTGCSVTCGNGTNSRNRTCNNPTPEFGGDNCTGSDIEQASCVQYPCPIDGNWTEWSNWTSECSVTCEVGVVYRNRSCSNPTPQYGGDNCTNLDNSTHIEYRECNTTVECPIDGGWSNWTDWYNCSDSCGVNCTIPCGNGTTERWRYCDSPTPQYGGLNCNGSNWENATCALPTICKNKFLVPAGAYVRNADYYYSFNEFVDSGAVQIFQNTGEYSFGLFNASASFIEQRNDSINNASTWYTVKFNKVIAQCIQIPGFDAENHTFIASPKTANNGLSMEVWLKMQRADLESEAVQTVIASGNLEDGGKGGIFLYTVANFVGVLIANGSQYWHVEKALPGSNQDIGAWFDRWFNLAFRWHAITGLQVFIDGGLIEEITYSRIMTDGVLPRDNKLYVGCRKEGTNLLDFSNLEMDELAFWVYFLPDKKLKWLTGAIVEPPEDTVFSYDTDIEELIPPESAVKNPYYEIADLYEPFDDTHTVPSTSPAFVEIPRGHLTGIDLSLIPADLTISDTDQAGSGSDLEQMTEGVSIGFWVQVNVSSISPVQELLMAASWKIELHATNVTFTAMYDDSYTVNSSVVTRYSEVVISFELPRERWVNLGMSWHVKSGVAVYMDGRSVKDMASIEKTEINALNKRTPLKIEFQQTSDSVYVSDFIVWKRYLYDFEVYRFLGMSKSETYLMLNADYVWTTDYYSSIDLRSMDQWKPIYKTFNSSIQSVSNTEIEGRANKGQAMEIKESNGWVMLGLDDIHGEFTPSTGLEFSGTCMSDPELCTNGLTVAIWLRIYEVPTDTRRYTIMTSGEEDILSRGFSIVLKEQKLSTSIVDGYNFWKVSLTKAQFKIDEWMHLAFTWNKNDGLWVFVDGELKATQLEGFPERRYYDRYSRITLGRSNENSNFGSFLRFAFQEVAMYLRFLNTYEIREHFALIDNKYYATADLYWNKEHLITSTLNILQDAQTDSKYVGPVGETSAYNNTISMIEGAEITLKYEDKSTSCLIDPTNCINGFTVSVWARNNLMVEDGLPIFIASSHDNPQGIYEGTLRGWTIFFIDSTWRATVVSDSKMWNITMSSLSEQRLLVQRWTNLAITWTQNTGVSMFMDGQVSGIMRAGYSVSPAAAAGTVNSPIMGNRNSISTTSIGVYNLAFWNKYYFGSNAYQLTGHEEAQIEKYSKSDLMWTFDGPIDDCNVKYDEMVIPLKTYDDTYKGAAVSVTRDSLNTATLGDYSQECLTQPSTCGEGFQISMKLKLINYIPGDAPDDIGSVFLLGSPDANFEGLAIQQFRPKDVEDRYTDENKLRIIVANHERVWSREIDVPIKIWFEIVIGWNVRDGIQVKQDNVKRPGSGKSRKLPAGSAKLQTNILMLGIGSGGGSTQAITASYNDIAITYNSEVAIEQKGRCYSSAKLYYRLNKGQIFTMEEVSYPEDRESLPNSAFKLKKNGYLELDEFPGQCISDPSICTAGLTVSFYMKVLTALNVSSTVLSSGYPITRGFQISVVQSPAAESDAVLTTILNNGAKKWSAQVAVAKTKWINFAFTWSDAADIGLNLFVDGELKDNDPIGVLETLPVKTSRTSLVFGRGNDYADLDFSDIVVDDLALWEDDLSVSATSESDLERKIVGSDCDEEGLVVEAEERVLEVTETFSANDPVTLKPPNCTIWIEESEICAQDAADLNQQLINRSSEVTINVDTMNDALNEVLAEVRSLNNSEINQPEQLNEFVETLSLLPRLPVPTEVNPDVCKNTLDTVLQIGSLILAPESWEEDWESLSENGTSSATVLKNIDDLALALTLNMQIGLNKKDDCTTVKSGSNNIIMSSEKRRHFLCARPFIFPQYDELVKDAKLNRTLENWAIPTDRVYIPDNTWNKADLPDDTVVAVVVMMYNNIEDVLPGNIDQESYKPKGTTSADDLVEQSANVEGKDITVAINSRIISIVVSPPITPPLEECIEISLEHKHKNKGNKRPAYCSFWDQSLNRRKGAWSTEGCEQTATNETHTICCCNHLTSFAIMMEPLEEEVVDNISAYFGYAKIAAVSLSLLCLFIFSGALICNKTLRYSERNMVHLNLCIAMIFALSCFLVVDFVFEEPILCQVLAIAQHYFNVVAYTWIFIEALCLFYAVLYDELNQKMKCYAPLGWLTPAVLVAVCTYMWHDQYGLNERCWLTFNDYKILAMIVPVMSCLLLDLAILLIVICNLPSPQLKRQDILAEIRTAIKLTMLLAPVLMFMWSIALIQVTRLTVLDVMFTHIFTALFSLQGVFVFLVYGIGQNSIRSALMMRKYQPTYNNPSSGRQSLIGSLSSSDPSIKDLVDVKPQPMSRPTSGKASGKARVSPRDTPREAFSAKSTSRGGSASSRASSRASRRLSTRRPSTPDDHAYIP